MVATRPGSSDPGVGWAMPPAAPDAVEAAQGLGQSAGVGVVVGEPVDHAVRPVRQRDEPGGREDPGLAHAAADQLARPRRAR